MVCALTYMIGMICQYNKKAPKGRFVVAGTTCVLRFMRVAHPACSLSLYCPAAKSSEYDVLARGSCK